MDVQTKADTAAAAADSLAEKLDALSKALQTRVRWRRPRRHQAGRGEEKARVTRQES